METLNYTKMSGAGNTFIMLDGRELPADIDLGALAPVFCDEALEHGGADGLIAVGPWDGGDFEMRYYNRDGSTGMMCGNGGRCAVRFACDLGLVADPSAITFVNAGVSYTALLTDRGVKVSFPDPRGFRLRFPLQLLGAFRTCSYADVGTPHAILFIDDAGEEQLRHISQLDLNIWGSRLRNHTEFAPGGANANFVEILQDRSGILLRTYERGMEGETGACGTGAISSAIVASTLRGLEPPVSVTTSSRGTLWVDFRREGERITDVSLEGDAETVMTGTLHVEPIPQ
jgi:diaminopimelate epimerase